MEKKQKLENFGTPKASELVKDLGKNKNEISFSKPEYVSHTRGFVGVDHKLYKPDKKAIEESGKENFSTKTEPVKNKISFSKPVYVSEKHGFVGADKRFYKYNKSNKPKVVRKHWSKEYKSWFWKSFGFKTLWTIFICSWLITAALLICGMLAGFGVISKLTSDAGWTFLVFAVISGISLIIFAFNWRFNWKLWRKGWAKREFFATNGKFREIKSKKRAIKDLERRNYILVQDNDELKAEIENLNHKINNN